MPAQVINPISTQQVGGESRTLDIARLQKWHLFGEAGKEAPPVVKVVKPTVERDGIEKNAKDTRLNLVLRGVASTAEDGLGQAIIEYKSKQSVYAVEDKLPVPGRVTLAKVMPHQVILDNGGTYERLQLFGKSTIGSSVPAPAPVSRPRQPAANAQLDKRGEPDTSALAASYRERLYRDPQSLASVVSISAVRKDNALLGYRVAPGKEREQFEQLGFKAGDLVTSVNGITLDNPANTMRLYNAMRSAGEVVFELERDSQQISLSVNLDSGGAQ